MLHVACSFLLKSKWKFRFNITFYFLYIIYIIIYIIYKLSFEPKKEHATCNMQHFTSPVFMREQPEKQLWLTSVKSAQKSVIGVEDYTTYKHHISARHTTSAPHIRKSYIFFIEPPASRPYQDFLLVFNPMAQACQVYDLVVPSLWLRQIKS